MTRRLDEVISLLIENSAEAALISSKDYEMLEEISRA